MVTYSLLDVLVSLAGWEVRERRKLGRVRQDLAAIDEVVRVVAELAHSTKDKLKAVLQLSLVGWGRGS